ncbi:MAG: M50 family metallopeptidase [Sporomusaceae bacterium]|nr:M50 family metallopeptidase [Sporomusaceae bacterium]
MRFVKIAGIQVILNYWFIALILLFALAGMASKVLLVFSAVLWHELAHAGVSMFFGCKVREVELLPFGGVARVEGLGAICSSKEIMIAAAGPAASLVLAALSYTGMLYAGLYSEVWEFYFKTNMTLAAFNLLPGLPLDGGRILRAWLALYVDYGKATGLAAGASKGISLCLLMIVVYEYMTNSTMNVTFLVAAIFLYTAAKSEIKVAGFRTLRILGQKKADLIALGIMKTTYLTVLNHVILKDIVRLFTPDQYYVLLVVNAECKVCGTLTETEIWEELPHRGLYAAIGEFIR